MSSEAAPGLLLVLSAPSGAGKTTIARAYQARHPDVAFSVSATTRAPRPAERDGVDYHFVRRERFAALVEDGAFAEWAEVHGERYGTLRATVQASLAAGRVTLFDVDVQGGDALRAAFPRDAVTVFVMAPSWGELERRLRGRSTDADDVVRRRLANARVEIERGRTSYDYVVVNDEIPAAVARLEAIVAHERALRAGAGDDPAAAIAASCRRDRVDWAALGPA